MEQFLLRQGEKLLPSGREKRLASDHSVTVHGNRWYDHAAEKGGGPVSFLQKFYQLSYPEAVTRLLNGEQGTIQEPVRQEKQRVRQPFVLPPASRTMCRVYAYLLQQRLISREVLDSFVRAKLIYESAEPSKDGSREYHNAIFIGNDENGVARHAHKRGLYTLGPGFKRNVGGCDPRYSFHHNGTSDRLYVFEAPIDLLSFVTLYPNDWQRHSYVALCGTSSHAMLWMLEQKPELKKVLLCLDHDEAGIEATERLMDILQKKEYSAWPRPPDWKDWNEALKAKSGVMAEPAEEHPQLIAAVPVCEEIVSRCIFVDPNKALRQIPELLQGYRSDVHWGRFEQAIEKITHAAALALAVVRREYRQMREDMSPQHMTELLLECIHPYQNRSALHSRAAEISMEFQKVLAQNHAAGIRTKEDKQHLADVWLDLAVSCAKVPIKYEADQMKQQQKQEESISMTMR